MTGLKVLGFVAAFTAACLLLFVAIVFTAEWADRVRRWAHNKARPELQVIALRREMRANEKKGALL